MAYLYPYGDSQQLNLSWFLAKFKDLYEYVMNLDPGEASMDTILSRFTDQYDPTTTYVAGDYCIFDGYIYKANQTTSGMFNSGAWDPALPVNDIQGLRILISQLSQSVEDLEEDAVTNVQYTPGAATANGLLQQTVNGSASTVMTVDKGPTENSQNPVKSGAVYDDLAEIKGSLNTLDTQTNSVEWTPASGDTLLAFILANVNRTKLPFSFVRIGNATVTDAPSELQAVEFTGIIFGNSRRMTVLLTKYGNDSNIVYYRNIFENGFYQNWQLLKEQITVSNDTNSLSVYNNAGITISTQYHYRIGLLHTYRFIFTVGSSDIPALTEIIDGLATPYGSWFNGQPVFYGWNNGLRQAKLFLQSNGTRISCTEVLPANSQWRAELTFF